MKRLVAGLALVATVAVGASIVTWLPGDTLTVAQLNSNFSHIHSTMVGGHGPRLVDSDVNASANIDIAKLSSSEGLPRVIANLEYTADAGYFFNYIAQRDPTELLTLTNCDSDMCTVHYVGPDLTPLWYVHSQNSFHTRATASINSLSWSEAHNSGGYRVAAVIMSEKYPMDGGTGLFSPGLRAPTTVTIW